MKIAIIGAGYVGLSLAVLLSQKHEVALVDIIEEKVKAINNRISPLKEQEISDYLAHKNLNLKATLNLDEALLDARFVIIATPTNYDENKNYFDTSSVEQVIARILLINPSASIIIKSTIPVGYVLAMRRHFKSENIYFSPEFLREGKALYDNLYPSRIIVGDYHENARQFADLLVEGARNKNVSVVFMHPSEAEAVKLFANTYLAMRVTFFNELDTYAEIRGLDSKAIIQGVGMDPRIGDHYNNPSFGYGGYCLPKDTKQLLANYEDVPNNVIKAIVEGNATRKNHIVDMIMKFKVQTVGIYRLIMKKDADNIRTSVMVEIIDLLQAKGVHVIVYEPLVKDKEIANVTLVNNLKTFKEMSDIIVANRLEDELHDVTEKVYSRDIFKVN